MVKRPATDDIASTRHLCFLKRPHVEDEGAIRRDRAFVFVV